MLKYTVYRDVNCDKNDAKYRGEKLNAEFFCEIELHLFGFLMELEFEL
jgi:hypothetical protein